MVKVRSAMQWVGAAGSACLMVAMLGTRIGWLAAIGVPVCAFLIVYWLTTPLRIGEDEVVVRPHLRSRRIPRSEIVATDAIKTQGWPSVWQLRLHLADGSTVMIDRVAQFRDGGAVDRARGLLA
jgi:hypothetical protein